MLLITNDRENKRKASEEGIPAETGAHSHLFFSNEFCECFYEVWCDCFAAAVLTYDFGLLIH